MKTSPKELARALYLATKNATADELKPLIANFVAVIGRHGLESMLHDALASLPEVMEDIDSRTRITVETASPIDDAREAEALAAAGISSKGREVVRKVVPDLVGGIRIRTEDRVIDATVRHTLDDLKNVLTRTVSS